MTRPDAIYIDGYGWYKIPPHENIKDFFERYRKAIS